MLDDYLRDHDGVITRAQARSAGISDDSISRRVRSGHWRRCAPGVFFVDDRPFTDAARVRSAVWSYGPAATASGLAAAWWHGVTRFPPECVEVTVPNVRNHRKRDGIRVRRRDLLSDDIVELNGLRVTALPLSVIEAAARRRGGATLMDGALQRHVELENDRERQNIVSLHGYQVLRFTWLDLTEYPDRVLTEIRNALRLRRSA
ncbi:hypothetical protein BVU76_05080 [Mycolicibacterium porcinum]|nr:hypothetical protein BVU76_05080 [Mycolicibacterium porcinum]